MKAVSPHVPFSLLLYFFFPAVGGGLERRDYFCLLRFHVPTPPPPTPSPPAAGGKVKAIHTDLIVYILAQHLCGIMLDISLTFMK